MSFMQHEVTEKQKWLQIEGNCGTTWLPVQVIGDLGLKVGESTDEPATLKNCSDYYEGTPDTVGLIVGYGARLSAPGYLDCTEWSVFDTQEEAEQYLEETYPEDEDEEDEE